MRNYALIGYLRYVFVPRLFDHDAADRCLLDRETVADVPRLDLAGLLPEALLADIMIGEIFFIRDAKRQPGDVAVYLGPPGDVSCFRRIVLSKFDFVSVGTV